MNYSPLKNYEVGLRDRSRTRGLKKNNYKTDKIVKILNKK